MRETTRLLQKSVANPWRSVLQCAFLAGRATAGGGHSRWDTETVAWKASGACLTGLWRDSSDFLYATDRTTFAELRNYTKSFFNVVEEGERVRVYRNGRPVADIVPVKAAMPAWKKPPQTRLSLDGLGLGDEVVADRDEKR